MSDPLAGARSRAQELGPGFIILWEQVAAIIKRDGDPSDPNASVSGATNEIIDLCRKFFLK